MFITISCCLSTFSVSNHSVTILEVKLLEIFVQSQEWNQLYTFMIWTFINHLNQSWNSDQKLTRKRISNESAIRKLSLIWHGTQIINTSWQVLQSIKQ